MKINWKVRFKNKIWVASFFSLLIGFIFSMLQLFDIYPAFTESQALKISEQVLTFLGLIGVLQDPTTQGLNDSVRAMSYEEPWVDEPPEEDCELKSEDKEA